MLKVLITSSNDVLSRSYGVSLAIKEMINNY